MKRIAAIALIVLALCLLGYGAVRNVSAGTAPKKLYTAPKYYLRTASYVGMGCRRIQFRFIGDKKILRLSA